MVYVTPAETYDQAIHYAKTVFPHELGHVDRHRITFSVRVNALNSVQTAQIGPTAWTTKLSAHSFASRS